MNLSKREIKLGILSLAVLIIIAGSSVSFSSIDFAEPTISDNATTNLNWTYINISSNDVLFQSILEWGNSSGFTNISMLNSSLTNLTWYINKTTLADGAYNYTIWTENTTGSWNQSERRFVTVDTVAPYSIYACQDLTIENGSYVLAQNVSAAGTCFTISANNITLDGAGYTVLYATSSLGYAINYSENNGSVIKNLKIVQDSNTASHAIYGFGLINSTIMNNTITANGLDSYGIYLTSSNNSAISENIISTTLSISHGIYLNSSSNSNNISNNNITTSFTASIGIYVDDSSNSNSILENNITTFGNGGDGIRVSSSNNSSINNNTIRTFGVDGDGILLWFSSDLNTVLNNNITTSGGTGYGIHIYMSSNSNVSENKINTTNAYSIFIDALTNDQYNHTIDTTNTEQGEPIYYYFGNSSITIENLTNVGQLYVANSTNITLRNVTLDKDGIIFAATTNSTIEDSVITVLENYGHGIYLYSSSNSNNISNNNITSSGTNGYGIYVLSSGSNTISGDSITSQGQSYEYSLSNASTTNNFTATNFTASREIYFADTTSYFNYKNQTSGSIWLKTNISTSGSINRTLINWNITLMKWNDTNSTAGISANYIITDMNGTSIYLIYNTSAGVVNNPYNLTTNANGNMPSFNISLNGNTEIKAVYYGAYVAPASAPSCSDGVQNGDETGTDCGGSCSACTPGGGGGADITTKYVTRSPSNTALTKVEVTLKKTVTNPDVTVTKRASISFATPSGSIYQYLEISKSNFNNSDISTAIIEFKVNKSWIAANDITSVYLSRYENGWANLTTELINSTGTYNKYRAQTPGFSYFAIIGLTASTPSAPIPVPEKPSSNTTSEPTAKNNILNERSNITPGINSGINSTTDTEDAPKKNSYSWILVLIVAVIMFVGVAFFIIDRKTKKKEMQEFEMMEQPPQILIESESQIDKPPRSMIEPQKESEYIHSEKNALEDAETEYLIERLKETKKQVQ